VNQNSLRKSLTKHYKNQFKLVGLENHLITNYFVLF
jgi:hypothetical protein